MSDYIRLANNATGLDTAPVFAPFSGVKLWCDDTNFVFSGTDTGRVLEADLPWATQEIADNVLASIEGFEYQPFSAQNALLDPAAELGDGVSVGGVYSVLAACDTNFNAMCASNISAPSDEEIDHEYHYTSPEKRMERRVSKMTSELRVMSDSISGVVEDVEGNRAEFQQTAEELSQRITAADGKATEAQQTAEGFSQRISNVEGDIVEINSSVDGISQRVTNAEGTASEALQTANGFSQRVSNAEGDIAEIEFSLEGVAYKSSLADGTTVINGGCISTGTIDASKADIKNLSVEKLTVAGKNIGDTSSALSAIYSAYGSITALTSHGLTLDVNSADEGVAVLVTAAGVKVGSNAIVSWQDIIAGGQNATAVFG